MYTIRIMLALAAVALTGCASTRTNNPADPLESFNRGVYQFNDTLDKAIAKPVAKGYNAVMPEPGKILVTNFFSNLDDVIVTANDLLQLKFAQAASDGSRFVFNTTFGVFGLLNVTSRLEKHDEDFGQTLGYWGIGSGPYIVLPILGPSSVRDGIGLYVDSRPSKLRRVNHMRTRNQLYLTKAVNRRAQLLEQEKVLDEAVIDRYEFIRDAYLLHRQSQVYDGNPPREKYEEEDEDIDNKQVPIPNVPSSKLESTPAAQSVGEAQPAETAKPQIKAAHSVHKVWVAQNTGIR
ncbi:lipoprotein [Ferrigenium kumadai]|uniref:Lipoprotein n=1 Tax=Ferrigenium kumadai TaxID=1682490 RepID=A0AAN1T0E1_9PROT|nr:VacJ family lipoprotein [Ferrigenium kumadai]BBI99074.1 lipoprotein [Ferrigenium kumadai]